MASSIYQTRRPNRKHDQAKPCHLIIKTSARQLEAEDPPSPKPLPPQPPPSPVQKNFQPNSTMVVSYV
ncbi:hypothetical protein BT63DRAFT_451876 [Microthyrium microscopicum]|uniref:Uncharacterized protein n=1 Tax=Microthyrium microscopicum TaxID=703497 RepID=A0A6A6UQV7_9PEZI|nr:hypothetical protein BT63DRAFT_451876 [Microthyrium microscopicum]